MACLQEEIRWSGTTEVAAVERLLESSRVLVLVELMVLLLALANDVFLDVDAEESLASFARGFRCVLLKLRSDTLAALAELDDFRWDHAGSLVCPVVFVATRRRQKAVETATSSHSSCHALELFVILPEQGVNTLPPRMTRPPMADRHKHPVILSKCAQER